MEPGRIRIGISGWTYKPWRGTFYPSKLPQKKELAYAAERFPSIEINGTFYGLQRPEAFTEWRAETPDDFVFSIKGSRYITHMSSRELLRFRPAAPRPEARPDPVAVPASNEIRTRAL